MELKYALVDKDGIVLDVSPYPFTVRRSLRIDCTTGKSEIVETAQPIPDGLEQVEADFTAFTGELSKFDRKTKKVIRDDDAMVALKVQRDAEKKAGTRPEPLVGRPVL